jgi:hypothetical protein
VEAGGSVGALESWLACKVAATPPIWAQRVGVTLATVDVVPVRTT